MTRSSIKEIKRLAGKRFDDKANADNKDMLILMLFERLEAIEKLCNLDEVDRNKKPYWTQIKEE